MSFPRVKSATTSAARQRSHRRARGSCSIQEAAVALQACPHVRIANCFEHHEVDCSPYCLFERLAEAEELPSDAGRRPGSNSTRKSTSERAGSKSSSLAAEPTTSSLLTPCSLQRRSSSGSFSSSRFSTLELLLE